MENTTIRFLHLSDTHFGVHYAINPRNKLRRAYGNLFFDKVNEILRKSQNIDFILHAGDFFNRSKPPPEVIDRAVTPFIEAAKKIPIYIIPGNHERSRLPLGLLSYQDNFNLFIKPSHFVYEKNGIKIKITGFPYIRRKIKTLFPTIIQRAWRNNCSEISSSGYHYSILLMHQLIQGSRIENYTFRSGDNIIPYALIPNKKFDYIANGHVHRFQYLYPKNTDGVGSINTQFVISQKISQRKWKFGSTLSYNRGYDNPVIGYAGSLERVSFQEKNESKGYIIGEVRGPDSESGILQIKYEFHPIKAIPMVYQEWNLTFKPITKLVEEWINYLQINNENIISNKINSVHKIKIVGGKEFPSQAINQLKKEAVRQKVYLTISYVKNRNLSIKGT